MNQPAYADDTQIKERIEMSPTTQIEVNHGAYLPGGSVYTEPVECTARQPLPKRVQTGIKCPSCKSPQIRYSNSFTVIDGLLGMIGMRALRCHSCYNKFHRLFA
ncbi:MAG TPA: hypothetical protein VFB63_02180 [Bryobacteraceae bacterium]|jgi:hypothetical protein|nr:hypothetical protein [Bryobacteraceae bacterium]